MFEVQGDYYPSRHLMTITAKGMARGTIAFDGPLGRRTVARPESGRFEGARISGEILCHLANEWRTESPFQEGLSQIEGLIALQSDEGRTIFMKYIGRRSARYGETSWRLGVGFEADREGPDWLNELHAAATVEQVGDDLVFTVHELVRADAPDAEHFFRITPLYQMIARDSVGKRHMIDGQVARRYFSVAERGCRANGLVDAEWVEGFSWGSHRMGTVAGRMPMHIDMRAAMVTDDGVPIIQHYTGVSQSELMSTEPGADRSWRTTAVFETAASGAYAWLNGVVAIGLGWAADNEAQYRYYIME